MPEVNAELVYVDKCNWRCTSFCYSTPEGKVRAYFSKETLLAIKLYDKNNKITFIPKIHPDNIVQGMYVHFDRALGISVKTYLELWNEYQLKLENE